MRKRNDWEWQINLQSKGRPGAFYTRKHNDFSAVGGPRTYTSRKFTVEMKARRILHWKTQRFLCGRWRTEEGAYINKEQRLTDCQLFGLSHDIPTEPRNKPLLSIKSWLVQRDPLLMFNILPIKLVSIIL